MTEGSDKIGGKSEVSRAPCNISSTRYKVYDILEDHPFFFKKKKAMFLKFKGNRHLFSEVIGPSFPCPLPSHQIVSQLEGNSKVGFTRLSVLLIPLRMKVQMQRIR